MGDKLTNEDRAEIEGVRNVVMATNFGTVLAANGLWRKTTTWGFRVMDGSLSVIYGDGNCSRQATVRLGIDTLIANILVWLY